MPACAKNGDFGCGWKRSRSWPCRRNGKGGVILRSSRPHLCQNCERMENGGVALSHICCVMDAGEIEEQNRRHDPCESFVLQMKVKIVTLRVQRDRSERQCKSAEGVRRASLKLPPLALHWSTTSVCLHRCEIIKSNHQTTGVITALLLFE